MISDTSIPGFAAAVRTSIPTLSGDFYDLPDDVVRSVTLTPGDAMGFSQKFDISESSWMEHMSEPAGTSSPRPTLSGSFYDISDDVVRGVTFSLGDAMGVSQVFGGSKFSELEQTETSTNPHEVFAATDVPQALSDEMRVHMEATALQLKDHSPATAGNNVLTFFREMVDARVKKVNQKKFTMRAEAALEGLPVDIKVRVYQDKQGSVVEFQKRSGDTVAFVHLYRQVSAYLQCPSSDPAAVLGVELPKVPPMTALPPAEAIAPLLNMVGSGQNVKWLAEVASALTFMSQDPMVAAELRMPAASSVFQHIQESKDFRVTLLATHLLSCICGQALLVPSPVA